MVEIARPESPSDPLTLSAYKMTGYTDILEVGDSVLRSKGGVANLSIYKELMRDDQVSSTWMQRRLAVTSCDIVVEPGAKDAASTAAAEALQEELDALNWDDITDKMLNAIFYGWGVAEIIWKPNGSRVSFGAIKVRDRARFRFDIRGGLHLWTAGSGFVEMPDRKFWTMTAGADHHDEPYGLGLAHALYWPVFFKRNDIKFWLIFLEKFGMPTAVAKLSKSQLDQPAEVAKAVVMLRRIATDAGVVIPEDGEKGPIVELLEAARSGAADYEGMKKAMDAAIAKIVIGQTATTEGTPGRLGSDKTQQDVAQKIVEADSDLLCGGFNAGPVKWWTEMNFPGATAPRVYRHTEPAEDLAARAERDTKIFGLGYEPTEDYIAETYGEGWEKKKTPEPLQGAPGLPGMPGQPSANAANFAEAEALRALRAARRGDQQSLLDAAVTFAEQYETIMGRQVGAILQAAEQAGDPAVFRERLNELLEGDPSAEAVTKLTRAGVFARMMGALRAQRRA